MTIHIQRLSGKIFDLVVSPTDTIFKIKQQIRKKNPEISPERLFFGGAPLEDDQTLQDYGISDYSKLTLTVYGSFHSYKSKHKYDDMMISKYSSNDILLSLAV